MKTIQLNKKTVERRWHLLDAKDQILGRLASHVAQKLVGKDKRQYSSHVDCGDYVVIVNAEGIKIKGSNKPTQKIDFRHSGYPGGHTMIPYSEFLKRKPERAISLAVSGMLPKTRLRKSQMTRLKVYRGSSHPHGAQFVKPAPAIPPSTPSALQPAAH